MQGWRCHLVRAILQSTLLVRHSERSEESLSVLNGRDTEGFLASLGMTDGFFSPNQNPLCPSPFVSPFFFERPGHGGIPRFARNDGRFVSAKSNDTRTFLLGSSSLCPLWPSSMLS